MNHAHESIEMRTHHLMPTISLIILGGRVAGALRAQLQPYIPPLYPDIRGYQASDCGGQETIIGDYPLYVCDPANVLRLNEIVSLNIHLHNFSLNTNCECQRRSQCTTTTPMGKEYFFGFVAALAVVHDIQTDRSPPSESEILEKGQQFATKVANKWSLGDCGNSAVILLWAGQQKIFISVGRTSRRFLTENEQVNIIDMVKLNLRNKQFKLALESVIDAMRAEFNGEPDTRVAIGTVSLVTTVAVALFFVLVIIGCVCAFRCFGNLSPLEEKEQQKPVTGITLSTDAFSNFDSQSMMKSMTKRPMQPVDVRTLDGISHGTTTIPSPISIRKPTHRYHLPSENSQPQLPSYMPPTKNKNVCSSNTQSPILPRSAKHSPLMGMRGSPAREAPPSFQHLQLHDETTIV